MSIGVNNDNRKKMQPGEYKFHPVNAEEIVPGKKQIDTTQEMNVRVENLLSGKGTTCLVYEGRLVNSGRKVIIKEFYPYSDRNVWGIIRSDDEQKLYIPGMVWAVESEEITEIRSKFSQFIKSYQWQKKFNQESDFLEIAVEVQCLAVYGDSYYIISDYHSGMSLRDKMDCFKSLKDKIHLCNYLTDIVSVLAENNYLFLDICKDNFLVIQQTENRYQLRLFDFDSIINLSRLDELHHAEGNIFYHEEYASQEIRNLEKKLLKKRFDDIKKTYLEESAMVYSLGVLFFEILFSRLPSEDEREVRNFSGLVEELSDKYEISADRARELLEILKGMLLGLGERYDSCKKVLQLLEIFAEELYHDTYVSQKRIAEANATLVAYNMLQKHPLYQYCEWKEDGQKVLRVAIVGSHMMRAGFLSAVISIGQMLNAKLEVTISALDSQEFWEDYVSKEKNAALKNAVEIYLDEEKISEEIDYRLVSRPLARININTKEKSILRLYHEKNYRYFVLFENIDQELRIVSEAKTDHKLFISYVQKKKYAQEMDNADLYWISGYMYDEVYNEDVYKKDVYKMGFMAHLYYCGGLSDNSNEDLAKLEEEYNGNIYNRLSSERAAVHGIYKMVSIDVDPNKPGRFRRYFEKISNEKVVEQLGWLEHISWTAYMLVSGHKPISTSELDNYAYQNGNDWKNRRNPNKIEHPLLAASVPEKRLPENGWEKMKQEEYEKLDPLDRVSCEIYQWYCKKKESIMEEFKKVFQKYYFVMNSNNHHIFQAIQVAGGECIECMGVTQNNQDKTSVTRWNQTIKMAKDYLENELEAYMVEKKIMDIFIDSVEKMMKPVIDSYKNRDFKQNDRDIVYSVLDIIIC